MPQDLPPPTPRQTLPEIVVTAARLPPAVADAAFSVVRLDPQVLERSMRLDEALRTVPAVSLFRRTSSSAANPTTQGISLRAIAPSGAGRTLVTLDGVPMATRCGALDAGVVIHLLKAGRDPGEIEDLLYHRSGLLGASGISADSRVLLESDEGQAKEAIELFTFRIVGIWPAKVSAPASIMPKGAAKAFSPASIAS